MAKKENQISAKIERVYQCYECGWETRNRSLSCPKHPFSELVPMDKKTSGGDEVTYQQVYAPQ